MKRVLASVLFCSASLAAFGVNAASANSTEGLLKKTLKTCLSYTFLYYIAKASVFNGIVGKKFIPDYPLEKNGISCRKIPGESKISENDEPTMAYLKLNVNSASATKFGDTILISLGGNRADGHSTVYRGINREKNNFLLPTAAIKYRYFHDNSHSFVTKASRVSEKTVYEDGIRLYEYVTNVLGYRNVILLGYSIGGSVASNLAKYIESIGKGDTIKGIVLASPIDGIESSAEKYTGKKFLGNLTATLLKDEKLDTFDNLSCLKNRNIPLLLVSGGEKDFLSLKLTHIDKRLREAGFKNVYSITNNNYDHNGNTFDIEQIKLNTDTGNMEIDKKKVEEYLNSENSPWECLGPNGKKM